MIKEEDQKKLAEFVAGADFSSDIFKDIFVNLVEKHGEESLRQHMIRAIIEIWMKKYPAELSQFEKQMKQKRETRKDKFASTGMESQQRVVFNVPETVWNRINAMVKDPAFLSQSNPMTDAEKDEWAWFIREFPMFVVPDTI